MVVTDDLTLPQRFGVFMLDAGVGRKARSRRRTHPQYEHVSIGFNYRMSNRVANRLGRLERLELLAQYVAGLCANHRRFATG